MKPKVAFYWCASCGGCEEAIVDLDEELLDVTNAVEIVFWPVALDFKEHDVAEMPDRSIDIAFLNGAIRTSEQQRMARMLRDKSKVVVAFGACAQLGGIPGLANLTTREGILREVYGEETAPQLEYRDHDHYLTLPAIFDSVYALPHTVPVDYAVPGCPPSANIIKDALAALLSAAPPPRGTVLAPDRAACEDCPRKASRPAELSIDSFHRVPDQPIDPETCILAQGIPCLGAATRAGCGSRCIQGNMPCTGCFGPTSRVRDFGAKALSATASLVAAKEEPSIDRSLAGIADPVGTFYRYSLPSSFLERKRTE